MNSFARGLALKQQLGSGLFPCASENSRPEAGHEIVKRVEEVAPGYDT